MGAFVEFGPQGLQNFLSRPFCGLVGTSWALYQKVIRLVGHQIMTNTSMRLYEVTVYVHITQALANPHFFIQGVVLQKPFSVHTCILSCSCWKGFERTARGASSGMDGILSLKMVCKTVCKHAALWSPHWIKKWGSGFGLP